MNTARFSGEIQAGSPPVEGEWSIERGRKDELTGSQVFFMNKTDFPYAVPANGSAHPRDARIALESWTARSVEGHIVAVTGSYYGFSLSHNPTGSTGSSVYSMDISLSQDPVESSPLFSEGGSFQISEEHIAEVRDFINSPIREGGTADGDVILPTSWEEENRARAVLFEYLRRGIDSYRVARVTWTRSWVSRDSIPQSILNNVGLIDSPAGNPPNLEGDGNWLLVGARSSSRADDRFYENEQVWESSGRVGWNTGLYT